MNAQRILQDLLLVAAVIVAMVSSVGVLKAHTAYDRLHYVGAASVLCPILVALAVIVNDGLSQSSIKAVLVMVTLMATSPVLTHATARAALVREHGSLRTPIDTSDPRNIQQ